MAIPLVQVRHKETGKKSFLPESALPNFPDYVKTPSQKAREQVPDGSAFPGAAADEQDSGQQTPEQPPRGGAGATEEAWREYATGVGIEVPEDAGRDDIVALVDAQHPQD